MEIKQGGKAEALYARQHRGQGGHRALLRKQCSTDMEPGRNAVKEGEGEVSAPPAERTAWQEAFLCSENQFNT